MSLILGIDEAGRGPVIGPMTIGGAIIESSRLKELEELKLRDSKKIARDVRTELFSSLEGFLDGSRVLTYDPDSLKQNLTDLELDAIAELIEEFQPDEVFIDAPVPPRAIPGFVQLLRTRISKRDIKITAKNKADDIFPIVSAASILAKVSRDRAVEALWEIHGNFGWGYPSEPQTENFLRSCYESTGSFPDCVRMRWGTVQRIIGEVQQKSLRF